MGRLALVVLALSFGLAAGVATAAGGGTTPTTPTTTVTTTTATTVTEPPRTTTITRTETAPERTVTAPEPTTPASTVVVSTTPAQKSSSGGSDIPAWAWIVIGLAAVGIGTAIYMVGHNRGRQTAPVGPDQRAGGAPYDPNAPRR